MNFFERLGHAAERLLPSRASVHYVLAKTHYQWALYSASFGSVYWFNKAREGFDAHAKQIQAVRDEAPKSNRPEAARLAAWTRHCQHLRVGLKDAAGAARRIRELQLEHDQADAKERLQEEQAILRALHRRLRRPQPRQP